MLYTFQLQLNWKLINELSSIDRYAGTWSDIVKTQGQTLRQLKSIETVRSVGASTRIEGSSMSDAEVKALIDNLTIGKLEERDQQEVIGYFEALDLISEAYQDMPISESTIKALHNVLLKYSSKDEWHKGRYKQHANSVEAERAGEARYTIFKTTPPGWETEDAMRKLVEWYQQEKEAHPLVRAAAFVYDFLSIHPFQDGNGRLSRLLSTLLLLKEGYGWIEYVSFEHEIENRKNEYYRVLMECQRNRPGEDISSWIHFFTNCLSNIQQQLMQKLESKEQDISVSPRLQQIRMYIEHHPGAKTGDISTRLGLSLPTVKKDVASMVASGMLIRHGTGAGTHYTAKPRLVTRPDQMLKLSASEPKHSFSLTAPGSSRIIKKMVLTTLFEWTQPDEWVSKLYSQQLHLEIKCINRKKEEFIRRFLLGAYNTAYLFRPVFTLTVPIVIPETLFDRTVYQSDYPMQIDIELLGNVPSNDFAFDVLLVYDEKE
jgi:Fic family protein